MAILKGVKEKIDVKVTAEIDGDNGTTVKASFLATFKNPRSDEVAEIKERLSVKHDENGEITKEAMTVEEMMDEYLVGWSNVPTEAGEPFEFTPEHVSEMLSVPAYALALERGFYSATLGKDALKKILSRLEKLGL